MADYGVDLYGNTIIVSPAFAEKNPEAVKGFLRALTKAIEETIADPEAAVEYVVAANPVVDKATELERLKMAIDQNIVTDEVKKNGLGARRRGAARQRHRPDRPDVPVHREAHGRERLRPELPAGRGGARGRVAGTRVAGFVVLDRVRHAYGIDGLAPVVDDLSLSIERGAVRRGRRPVGLRQVDPDEARDRPAIPAGRRGDGGGRAGDAAGQDRRHGVPGADAAAVADDPRQHPPAARDRPAATGARCGGSAASSTRGPRRSSPRSASPAPATSIPWELSGGMQMRASLCRALIHEPQLLMLDEPFGALDAFTREELWCVIRDLHAASGVTIILVTHDLREAVFLADRIFVMSSRPGHVIAERAVDFPRPRELDAHLHASPSRTWCRSSAATSRWRAA